MDDPTLRTPPADDAPTRRLIDVLLEDQSRRWEEGDRVFAADYLERHPTLCADADGFLLLVEHELSLRSRRGESPRLEEYLSLYPQYGERIRGLFAGGRVSRDEGSSTSQDDTASPAEIRVEPPRSARYEILRELGRGGMGVVYLARDRRRDQLVALKTLQGVDAGALYRFKQEFRALAGVAHPNLAALYDFISDGQTWFFTMEYVPGGRFLEGLPPDQLRDAFRQLAEGVLALHEAGKLHRDLKPGNVLLTPEGRVVLLDFGLAADLDATGQHQSTERHLIGTAAYMAPEQAASQPTTPASDWYSVGVMLYEALTGRLPFDGPLIQILIQKQGLEPPPPPRDLAPDAPEDLNALSVELLRRDPAARPSGREVLRRLQGPSAAPVPAPPVVDRPAGRLPFVGRERQLAALADAFRAVEESRPVTVFVAGRSGMGKSTLIQHFLDGLSGRSDVLVLAGRCYEREAVPYKAVDSLIDALSRFLRRLPRLEAEAMLPRDAPLLARVFPVLHRVEVVAEAPRRGCDAPDAQELRRRAFAALRELLGRVGDRRRLVVSIDDLQWADVDSAALLSDLLRPPDPPVLLLIGCYRSEDEATSPFLRRLLADAELERRRLALDALTPDETRDLARELLASVVAGRGDCAEAIGRESGGSPLFVQELVQHLRGGPAKAEGAGAPTLENVLWDRIQLLTAPARRLLEVVAVAGRPLGEAAACQAAGVEGDGRAWLQRLQTARLIRTAGSAEREEIEPYHDRVRETMTARLSAEALRDCHGRIARALAAAPQTDPELLAAHFLGAGEEKHAAEHYIRSADRAAEALAFERAATLYRLVLDIAPADEPGRRRVQVRMAEALGNAGRGAEAARAYLAAAEGADTVEARELRQRAAWQFLISGHIDEGLAVLRTVLAAVGMTLPSSPRRTLWGLLWSRVRLRLRGLDFRERNTPLPADERARIEVCWSAAVGLGVVDFLCGAYFQARGLLLALDAGEPYFIARALGVEAAHAATGGTLTSGRTAHVLRLADEVGRKVGKPEVAGLVTMAKGIAAAFEGRWKEALHSCDEAEAIFRAGCTGVGWELDTTHRFALWALVFQGEAVEINRRLPALLKEAEDRDDLYAVVNLSTIIQPFARMAADEPLRARSELAAVLARWSQQGFHVQHLNRLSDEAQIDLYLGDGAAARQRLRQSWPLLARSHLLRVQQVRIFMGHTRGRAALAASAAAANPSSLLREAERDARALLREKAAWSEALARLLLAGVASRRGDRATAVALLREAVTGLEAVGMGLYAAAARRRLGELLGGDEGRALRAQADAWMAERQIKNPGRMTAMCAPGFADVGEKER